MNNHTRRTAPTQYVEASGIRFAYRRFGRASGPPLVFNQHYTGTMDYWDPAVTDGLARNREVILFNNAGVSSSSGDVPTTIAFNKSLGLNKVDVLGFSIGGMVAQEIAVQAPKYLPNAQLILYPDSNHGSFYQYHEVFVEQANQFLSWTLQKAESLPPDELLPFPSLRPGEGDDE